MDAEDISALAQTAGCPYERKTRIIDGQTLMAGSTDANAGTQGQS